MTWSTWGEYIRYWHCQSPHKIIIHKCTPNHTLVSNFSSDIKTFRSLVIMTDYRPHPQWGNQNWREPWSSGYGRGLMIKMTWVPISTPDSVWFISNMYLLENWVGIWNDWKSRKSCTELLILTQHLSRHSSWFAASTLCISNVYWSRSYTKNIIECKTARACSLSLSVCESVYCDVYSTPNYFFKLLVHFQTVAIVGCRPASFQDESFVHSITRNEWQKWQLRGRCNNVMSRGQWLWLSW